MTDETIATEEAQIPETPEQEVTPVQETPAQSKKDDAIKLLAQRNAAKARADAAEARIKELEEKANRADDLEQQLTKTAVETEERELKDKFFSEHPQAKELEELISAKVAEGTSYEDAFLIVAARNKPELLVEEAVMNKISGGTSLTGVAQPVSAPKVPQSAADLAKMSDADVLARQDNMAKAERVSQGFTN